MPTKKLVKKPTKKLAKPVSTTPKKSSKPQAKPVAKAPIKPLPTKAPVIQQQPSKPQGRSLGKRVWRFIQATLIGLITVVVVTASGIICLTSGSTLYDNTVYPALHTVWMGGLNSSNLTNFAGASMFLICAVMYVAGMLYMVCYTPSYMKSIYKRD